jgi:hypothetical protein
MKKSLVRVGFALACLVISGTKSAEAQQKTGRWMIQTGISGAPSGAPNSDMFAGAAARIATTGPVEWGIGTAMYGISTVSRGAIVSGGPYCPGGCHVDESEITHPVTAGITVRLVGLPWIFNRVIPEFGTGGYYARWTNLPAWEAERSPLATGYRVYALGLRVTRRVGLSIGGTQFRNIHHRDDFTPMWIALQVRVP